jgi:hypothetical protein
LTGGEHGVEVDEFDRAKLGIEVAPAAPNEQVFLSNAAAGVCAIEDYVVNAVGGGSATVWRSGASSQTPWRNRCRLRVALTALPSALSGGYDAVGALLNRRRDLFLSHCSNLTARTVVGFRARWRESLLGGFQAKGLFDLILACSFVSYSAQTARQAIIDALRRLSTKRGAGSEQGHAAPCSSWAQSGYLVILRASCRLR